MFALCGLSVVAVAAGDAVQNSPAVPPSERILQCVRRFSGLDASFTIVQAEGGTMADWLPYLQLPMGKQKGIRGRLSSGKVKWGQPLTGDDTFMRRFTVYLDSEAKRVLAVTSEAEAPSANAGADGAPEAAVTPIVVGGSGENTVAPHWK